MLWAISIIPLLLIVTLVIAEILYRFTYKGRITKRYPGPKEKPLIGNLTDILENAEGMFKKLRLWAKKYYPIYKLSSTSAFFGINLIAPEDIQHVLSNTNHNEKSDMYLLLHEWLGEGLLTSSGEKWQKRRKILTPTFHFNILKRFVPIFNKHSNAFAADLNNEVNKEVDILPHVHISTLHSVGESAMGNTIMDPVVEMKYRNCIKRMGEIMVYRMLRPWFYFRPTWWLTSYFYEERGLLQYLKNYTLQIITQREQNFDDNIFETPSNGLKFGHDNNDEERENFKITKSKKNLAMLDLLISAKLRSGIDTEGIREEVDTFTFEGHDTVSMAVSFAFMLLANNPQVQSKLYEEVMCVISDDDPSYEALQSLPYMDMVIKETLRLYPSVPLISRITGDQEIVTAQGNVIPARSNILIHIYDTHRLAEYYPEPDKFDPERFLPENSQIRHPYAYLPFSAGSRNCIGQKFAMLNMKSMISAVLQKYVLLPVDTPESIVLVCDLILRSQNGIKIKLKPRM